MAEPHLAAQLFLLACDPQRQRVPGRDRLGYVLRAGMLTELVLRGHLTDAGGHAALAAVTPTGDPLLDAVLAEISQDKPRRWRSWVRRRHVPVVGEVQAALARTGTIAVRQRPILGLFPGWVVTVGDPATRELLRNRVHAVLTGTGPVPAEEAALAALAATGELRAVLGPRELRTHRQRVQQLLAVCGPPGAALHKAIQDLKASAGAAGS